LSHREQERMEEIFAYAASERKTVPL